MSELKQTRKIISFEELCPKWTKAVQKGAMTEGIGADFKHCIIGEAYGFKDTECEECQSHAAELVNYDIGQTMHPSITIRFRDKQMTINHELFEKRKERFINHWNDKHT